MFKKIILASAILAATSTVALASEGPYIGASVGVNNSNFSLQDRFGSKVDLGARNAIGNLFAGYGALVNSNIYLGGEVFADLTNTSSDVETVTGLHHEKSTVSQKYGYGVSFIPGVMLSDHTMAYGRVGVVRSRFEFSNSTPGTTDVRKNINGGQIGLGLQTSLTQNLDLRGEYDYTKYKTTKLSNTTDFDPRADSFNLGLVYKFD